MKILNFGSLNIDYVYNVEHFVQPGETMASEQLNKFCGGKGLNQSIALAKAGAEVYHAGLVGDDGRMLIDCMNKYGVNTSLIKQTKGPSGHAIIQVDKNKQNSIILHGGANYKVSEDYIDKVLSKFNKNDILLVQNEISNMEYLLKQAKAKEMKIVINPAPMDTRVKAYPMELISILIVNEVEGRMLSGCNEPVNILGNLEKQYPSALIVLTLGSKGVICRSNKTTYYHGAYKINAIDSTAAGDTFIGFFLSRYLLDKNMDEILRISSMAAGISISREGASPSIPHLKEVLTAELDTIEGFNNELKSANEKD